MTSIKLNFIPSKTVFATVVYELMELVWVESYLDGSCWCHVSLLLIITHSSRYKTGTREPLKSEQSTEIVKQAASMGSNAKQVINKSKSRMEEKLLAKFRKRWITKHKRLWISINNSLLAVLGYLTINKHRFAVNCWVSENLGQRRKTRLNAHLIVSNEFSKKQLKS